ncbi:enediyne polyketide synthase [Arcicella aurantiaca]|uniref:Enediyne polyketide synthase n=1 Tax=Arcicella aurantiaca TaxID=591202 RepID=A0A316E595_9BACT|nr:type I polyketide synthase [Arcicella aurantiaca]PWK23873.1 enediyne polyketide synthase [Arcicella aurantiaca]
MKTNEGIAIVGMDCRYPGANSIEQYWDNILSLRQQFRHIPDKRLNMNDYYSKDKSKVDKTYSQTASVITGYSFDRIKYKVSKSTFERTDFTHWLALDVAAGALKDAGFENGEGLDKNRVGVVLGNSLTGEFSRSGIMRLRWPYVRKVLEKTLKNLNHTQEDINIILSNAEKTYKEPFPEPDADSLAGGLSNTISGRICNYFDFHGGGFTIDGACASSLLAFENGCNSILNNSLDVVLVGGVDLSIDPFEIIGFARNGALAMNEMEVYSTKSEGFWPGEGCGIVVLMKESEAMARNLNIYAVIKGCGISSDGSGGITRPKSETQQLAFDRAYEKAGYKISQVAMFEGHGTGTPTGDQVEISAIVNALKEAGKNDIPAILGSVKHLIGHTKAAAGVAGVIKASLAIKNGVIPASRRNTPHALLTENESLLRLATKPILWEKNIPMRASVSSMGFGGINVHLTMEEAPNNKKLKKLSGKIIKLSDSQRDSEVFPFSANSQQGFLEIIARLKSLSRDISRAELVDLSATITASFEDKGIWRGSVVAKTPNELAENLGVLENEIIQNKTRFIDTHKGIFFDCNGKSQPIGFLFPGQGAPIYPDFGAFSSWVNPSKTALKAPICGVADTSVAQPAILQNSLTSIEVLEKFGIEANFGIGHSLGEISALAWAGIIENDDAKNLAIARGKAMSQLGEKDGAMLAIKCDEKTIKEMISHYKVFITGYNGTGNFVVGGHIDEIQKVQNQALSKGIHHVKLKVSHAFHTPMMKQAAIQFKTDLEGIEFNTPIRKVISTVTAESICPETDIQQMLFEQIESPVYFSQAIDKIKHESPILIEVGPGNALSRSLQDYQDFEVVSLDFGNNSIRGLLNTLSLTYISGNPVYFDELSTNRFYKEFDIENWRLDAFVNPCEQNEFESSFSEETQEINLSATQNEAKDNLSGEMNLEASVIGITNYLKAIISKKVEIPFEMINSEDRLMSQLHINSLAITEILSIVIKAFNKSQIVFSEASILANSDANIEELSTVIFKGESSNMLGSSKDIISFEKIHNWSHIFQRKLNPKKASLLNIEQYGGNVFVAGNDDQVKLIAPILTDVSANIGDALVFVYSSALARKELFKFVDFLRKPEIKEAKKVVLIGIIDEVITGDLKPILKTFQLENPRYSTLSIEIQSKDNAFEKIVGEIRNATKYKEVSFGTDGVRAESELAFFYPEKANINNTLSTEDVILATGGGKGITFESVFSVAKCTGAKLIIMGRSLPESDDELRSNLKKLDENNINYKYLSVDVCSQKSVSEGISESIREFGNITAFIHGAGVNYPKALHLLEPQDFDRTLLVKVEGLKNVLAALNVHSLKLLIGYGSIIAQSGMHGNADYAWANDQLALLIESVGKENPHCRCMTLEWSVWDETGMGVSLNTINTLKEKGVFAIPVAHGVEILKAVIADKNYAGGRLIISGRFGNMLTLNYVKERLPLGRFVANIKHHIPKVEIVSEVSVNLKEDIYLQNHVFQGQYVFPTVMILEGMAQVCSALETEMPIWTFEDLKINKSIFIPQSEANTIRFIVTRVSRYTFHAVVQSEDSDFQVNCFEAYIKLGKNDNVALFKSLPLPYANKLPLDTETKFYDDLLFHHGPFRRINAFSELSALKSMASATENLTDLWFNAYLPQNQILGDAGLNDAAIHCHQACRPHQSLLPTAVGKIVFNPNPIEGPFFISTQEVHHIGNVTRINSYVVNAKGEIKQYWENLDLTSVAGSGFSGEWNLILLANYIEYLMIQFASSRNIHIPKNFINHLLPINYKDFDKVSIAVDGFYVTLKKHPIGTSEADILKQGKLFSQNLKISQIKEVVTLAIELLPKTAKITTLINTKENAYN